MPSKKNDDQKLADRATELYWRSGQSVNRIAEAMDLSKSGLYALIRPLPVERPCPECGEGLVFPNRTAHQKGIGSCPECGYVDDARAAAKAGAQDTRKPKVDASGAGVDGDPRERGKDLQPSGPGSALGRERRTMKSTRVLWGVVLLGIAAGLYVTRRGRSG